MIKLFDIAYVKKQGVENALSLPTPLGYIILEVIMNNSKISKVLPTIVGEISTNAYIYSWSFKEIQIELLKVRIEPSLPSPMKVTDCFAFLWRFENLSKKIDMQFSCRCLFTQKKLKGEPESGEGLIAQSWNDGNVRLTIGTEDEEDLLGRSENQQWLPARLAKDKLLIPEIIGYLENGIQVTLPSLFENEQGQIQFIVAWQERKDRFDYSTWQAVDMSYKKILKFVDEKGAHIVPATPKK